MPLVRISLIEGKPAEYRETIGEVVHRSMVATIGCPAQDRFQLVTEHARENFLYAPEYLGIAHSDDLVVIQITLNEGRTTELKKGLYRAIADGLALEVGLSPRDVFISLVEVKRENWSFGNGDAQYAT